MTNYFKQFECKTAKAGEILYNTELIGNVLLFVSSGKLIICNQNSTPVVEVNNGYFVLLPKEKCYIVKAETPVQTVLMHAETLSEMITEDPDWNPEKPVVLPIFPSLARTLYLIESYQQKRIRKSYNLN